MFTDTTAMSRWVPGLQHTHLVRARPDGLPDEVQFAYSGELSYALRYIYDLDARVVRWEPSEPARGGVRGFARFREVEGGTELTYALEHDGGRKAAERALDDPRTLVAAFARYLHEHRD